MADKIRVTLGNTNAPEGEDGILIVGLFDRVEIVHGSLVGYNDDEYSQAHTNIGFYSFFGGHEFIDADGGEWTDVTIQAVSPWGM